MVHEGDVECHIDREDGEKNAGRCVNDAYVPAEIIVNCTLLL